MTPQAILLNRRMPVLVGSDFFTQLLVAFKTQLTAPFDQVARISGRMRIMAGGAFPIRNHLVSTGRSYSHDTVVTLVAD